MELVNLTPLAATAFRQLDSDGGLDGVVAARGRFALRLDGRMKFHASQPGVQWADEYEGDPHASPLVRATDLAPFRPGTDVTFLGDSHAPSGAPLASWLAGVRIGDRLDQRVRVTGPRRWRFVEAAKSLWKREDGAWELSEPEAASSVPMCWTRAAGGPVLGVETAREGDAFFQNPLGAGVLDEARSERGAIHDAPQIERPDQPLAQARAEAAPAGFGLVPPWWLARRRHAGTYDEAWLNDRHPLLPHDFDERFWQAAAPDMVVAPWLQGDEEFSLTHLHPSWPVFDGMLPGFRLIVRVHRPGARAEDRELALDGVHFDLRQGLDDCFLAWRVRCPLEDAAKVRLVLHATGMDYRRLARAGEGAVA